jgi:hypothetical protein
MAIDLAAERRTKTPRESLAESTDHRHPISHSDTIDRCEQRHWLREVLTLDGASHDAQ